MIGGLRIRAIPTHEAPASARAGKKNLEPEWKMEEIAVEM
jgi:hypothetical protein